MRQADICDEYLLARAVAVAPVGSCQAYETDKQIEFKTQIAVTFRY
jgi:hypothetical protein